MDRVIEFERDGVNTDEFTENGTKYRFKDGALERQFLGAANREETKRYIKALRDHICNRDEEIGMLEMYNKDLISERDAIRARLDAAEARLEKERDQARESVVVMQSHVKELIAERDTLRAELDSLRADGKFDVAASYNARCAETDFNSRWPHMGDRERKFFVAMCADAEAYGRAQERKKWEREIKLAKPCPADRIAEIPTCNGRGVTFGDGE